MGSNYGDVEIEFDFEIIVKENILPQIAETPSSQNTFGLGNFGRVDPKLRTVVCLYWLLGLCQKGDNCAYLHKFDKSRMPQCKHGKLCKVKNCPLKHEEEEERAECIFFRQGFCMHGPICKFRHLKRPPDECPAIATFDQYVASGNVPLSKKRKTHQPNQFYKITLCKHWLEHGNCPFGEECHYAHGEADLKSVVSDEGNTQAQDQAIKYEAYDPFRGRMDETMTLPYGSSTKAVYFLMHSPDLPTLVKGYQGKYWGTSFRMAQEINDSFRNHEWVVIFFIVRGLRGIYGVGVVESPIPIYPSPYSPLVVEFPVKWLRILRLSVRMVSHLKIISGTPTTIGRSVYDGKVDKNAGYEILLIAYRKPEWDWTRDMERAICTINPANGSLIPSPPQPQPPDPSILFSYQWIDQVFTPAAGSIGNNSSNSTGNSNVNSGGNSRENNRDNSRGGRYDRDSSSNQRGQSSTQSRQNNSSSIGNNDYYSGDKPGFIVGCLTPMLNECFTRNLFGLPANRKSDAQRGIVPGTPLFLQDLQTGHLYGLFEAVSPPLDNHVPNAWSTVSLPLPVQIQFRTVLNGPPIPAHDPEVMMILNGTPPVDRIGSLNIRQTKALANTVAIRSGIWGPSHSGGRGQSSSTSSSSSSTGRSGGMGPNGGTGAGAGPGQYYRPPFKYNQTIPVNIPFNGDGYNVRRKLLGPQVSRINSIINEYGTSHTIKIRLRGIGSAFKEGPTSEEIPEPLHFVISVAEEEVLNPVCEKVTKLIESTKYELSNHRD